MLNVLRPPRARVPGVRQSIKSLSEAYNSNILNRVDDNGEHISNEYGFCQDDCRPSFESMMKNPNVSASRGELLAYLIFCVSIFLFLEELKHSSIVVFHVILDKNVWWRGSADCCFQTVDENIV